MIASIWKGRTAAVALTKRIRAQQRYLAAAVESSSTTTAMSGDEDDSTPLASLSSLGLTEVLVQPHVESISQLPEVADILQSNTRDTNVPALKQQVEALQRASDIFASFAPGGNEHTAVLTLLAERQHWLHYAGAQRTLQQIQEYVGGTTSGPTAVHVGLALAKTLWLQGDFAACVQQTQKLKQNMAAQMDLPPLHTAAVENAHLLGNFLHDGPLAARQAALSVDAVGLPLYIQAAQCLNMGVVEATWSLGHDCHGDRTCYVTQYDTAKELWQKGIDLLKSQSKDNDASTIHPFALTMEGLLQSNMAYAVLQIAGQEESHVAKASEHAREGLQALERIRNDETFSAWNRALPQPGWTRALALVAQCYHRAGHAVTAEGLLQTALDETHPTTLTMSPSCVLERRAAYQAYAALCKDWEKRQGDADRFLAKATSLDKQLGGGWKQATELHASLWFWMPFHT